MRQATRTGTAHLDRAGPRLGVVDQLLERLPGRVVVDHDHRDAAGQDVHRVEVGVVELGDRQHFVKLRVLGAIEQRVAVRGAAVDVLGRDGAGGTRLVLQDDLLAQDRLDVRRDRARDDVGGATRAPHDDPEQILLGEVGKGDMTADDQRGG